MKARARGTYRVGERSRRDERTHACDHQRMKAVTLSARRELNGAFVDGSNEHGREEERNNEMRGEERMMQLLEKEVEERKR